MGNTYAELIVAGRSEKGLEYFILNYASDHHSRNPKIQITEGQWERLNIIRKQLGIFMIICGAEHEYTYVPTVISLGVVMTVIRRCEKCERYDILAEAMQLFHEIGVDVAEEELL